MTALGLNVACVSQPRFSHQLKGRLACSCRYANNTNLQPSWTSNVRRFVLRTSQRQKYGGCFVYFPGIPNRRRSFHAVSFQDVSENDSEGNDAAASSSAPTLDWQQRERLWHQLQGSLQHWRQNLKDRGSLQIAKEFLSIKEVKISSKDAKQVFTEKLKELKPPQPSTLWSSTDPSIKWPLIIFGSLYLAVTISFGKAVSDELWRVWLIGPLAMSFYIRATVYTSHLCRDYAAPRIKTMFQFLSGIASGRLQKQYLEKRGATNAKRLIIRFAKWLYERYEDIIDWLWPTWRVFARFVRNLL